MSVWATADYGPWQSAHRWLSNKPGGRLPVLATRSTVHFPATQHHCLLTRTKRYCLQTDMCNNMRTIIT